MAVRIDIANAALGHVGEGYQIANLTTDRSPAGLAIRRSYDQCRQCMFAEHDWQFARRPPRSPCLRAGTRDLGLCLSAAGRLRGSPGAAEHGTVLDYGIGGATDATGEDVNLILTQSRRRILSGRAT